MINDHLIREFFYLVGGLNSDEGSDFSRSFMGFPTQVCIEFDEF